MSTHSQEASSMPSVRVYRSQSVHKQPVNDSDIVTRRRSGSVTIPARATSATPNPTSGGNGSRDISRSVPNSPPIRHHSANITNLQNQFSHNSKSSEHSSERRRRPSYMGDTCTSERRKLNNHSMAQKLDHPDDSESSGEDQELHQTTPEFRFGPPIVLPPIWKTSGGAQNSQRLQKGQKQRTSRTKRVPII